MGAMHTGQAGELLGQPAHRPDILGLDHVKVVSYAQAITAPQVFVGRIAIMGAGRAGC